jgi:hypothetical protein
VACVASVLAELAASVFNVKWQGCLETSPSVYQGLFYPEDRSSKFLCNTNNTAHIHTVFSPASRTIIITIIITEPQ